MSSTTQPRPDPDERPASRPEAAPPDPETHREKLLDDALEETFPASDPPSFVQPTVTG